jgi:hypothetical protein
MTPQEWLERNDKWATVSGPTATNIVRNLLTMESAASVRIKAMEDALKRIRAEHPASSPIVDEVLNVTPDRWASIADAQNKEKR